MSSREPHPIYPYSFTSNEPAPTYSLSKGLLILWIVLDLCLLATGITFIALSLTWMTPSPIRNMVLSDLDLFSLMALGGLFVATFILSLPSLLQSLSLAPKEHFSTTGLVALIVLLIVDQLAVVAGGAIVWWRTLQERNTFFLFWEANGAGMQSLLQNKFKCCGYFTACATDALSSPAPVCVDPITAYADWTLNALFTSMFASSILIVLFILVSACLAAALQHLERFRKIDIKRGKFFKV